MLIHKKKPAQHDDIRKRKVFVFFPVVINADIDAYLQYVWIVETYNNPNKRWVALKYFLTIKEATTYATEQDKKFNRMREKF